MIKNRYLASTNGTAKDTQTGLTWMRCLVGQTWDAKRNRCNGEAKDFKWEKAKKIRKTFAGYSGWRLPTIKELRSIVYCSNGNTKPNTFSFEKSSSVYGQVRLMPTIRTTRGAWILVVVTTTTTAVTMTGMFGWFAADSPLCSSISPPSVSYTSRRVWRNPCTNLYFVAKLSRVLPTAPRYIS